MPSKKTIIDILTNERWANLEAVYNERPRSIPWPGWKQSAIMHMTTGLDERTEAAASANAPSLLIALTHGARIGLTWGDHCRLVSRGNVVRCHVTPDGRTRLGHQAGIVIRSAAVYSCDTFDCDLASGDPPRHRPDLVGRLDGQSRIVAAWAVGEWYDDHGRARRCVELADKDRLDTAANHGDQKIWDAHPAKMARNTAISDLWRYLPRTADMDAVTQADHDEGAQPVGPQAASPALLDRAVTYHTPDAPTRIEPVVG